MACFQARAKWNICVMCMFGPITEQTWFLIFRFALPSIRTQAVIMWPPRIARWRAVLPYCNGRFEFKIKCLNVQQILLQEAGYSQLRSSKVCFINSINFNITMVSFVWCSRSAKQIPHIFKRSKNIGLCFVFLSGTQTWFWFQCALSQRAIKISTQNVFLSFNPACPAVPTVIYSHHTSTSHCSLIYCWYCAWLLNNCIPASRHTKYPVYSIDVCTMLQQLPNNFRMPMLRCKVQGWHVTLSKWRWNRMAFK